MAMVWRCSDGKSCSSLDVGDGFSGCSQAEGHLESCGLCRIHELLYTDPGRRRVIHEAASSHIAVLGIPSRSHDGLGMISRAFALDDAPLSLRARLCVSGCGVARRAELRWSDPQLGTEASCFAHQTAHMPANKTVRPWNAVGWSRAASQYIAQRRSSPVVSRSHCLGSLRHT